MDSIDSLFHANRHKSDSLCKFCHNALNHAPWCATQNSTVFYAYQIVAESARLTAGDSLVLHSLGVVWDQSQV